MAMHHIGAAHAGAHAHLHGHESHDAQGHEGHLFHHSEGHEGHLFHHSEGHEGHLFHHSEGHEGHLFHHLEGHGERDQGHAGTIPESQANPGTADFSLSNSQKQLYTEKIAQNEVTAISSREKNHAPESKRWTQTDKFSMAVGVFVMLNAVVLGVEADYGDMYPVVFMVIENIFTVVFLAELVAHFMVEGPRKYLGDHLNILDCFLVLMSVADVWVIRPIGVNADLRMMSVLRMLRLLRLARLLRLFRAFKELTLLVTGFIDSVRTLFWALMFLLVVVYAFAIFAQQTIGGARDCGDLSEDECSTELYQFNDEVGSQQSLFGTVDRSMLTLFVCLTEGCGIDIVRPTVLQSPVLIVFWSIFIFFTTFGLLNLIVGCFCENALQTAADNEKELDQVRDQRREKIIQDLRQAFTEMDEDKSGAISKDEFLHALLNNEQVIDCLIDLGLGEEANLFDTLDAERVGVINFDQFFDGLMLIMKGHEAAKAKDMVATFLCSQATFRSSKRVEEVARVILAEQAQLAADVKAVVNGGTPTWSRVAPKQIGVHDGRPVGSMMSPSPVWSPAPRSKRPNGSSDSSTAPSILPCPIKDGRSNGTPSIRSRAPSEAPSIPSSSQWTSSCSGLTPRFNPGLTLNPEAESVLEKATIEALMRVDEDQAPVQAPTTVNRAMQAALGKSQAEIPSKLQLAELLASIANVTGSISKETRDVQNRLSTIEKRLEQRSSRVSETNDIAPAPDTARSQRSKPEYV